MLVSFTCTCALCSLVICWLYLGYLSGRNIMYHLLSSGYYMNREYVVSVLYILVTIMNNSSK